jgi:hypothetical protein
METLGKGLVAIGLLIVVLGAGLLLAAKLGIQRIPGDIVWRKGNFTLYAPLGLMIVVSILLTIILNLFFAKR